MWEQNPSPYYLNKQIVVLWIIRDTTCRKNCYPSEMATIKVVPLSSLGLSSPLLTFGCHFFSFAKRLPWFAMYSIYYCPNGGYLFIFFKKTEQGRGYLFFHLRKWKYSPVYYPQEKKALSLSTSSYFFHHYSFFYSWFVCFVVFFWKKIISCFSRKHITFSGVYKSGKTSLPERTSSLKTPQTMTQRQNKTFALGITQSDNYCSSWATLSRVTLYAAAHERVEDLALMMMQPTQFYLQWIWETEREDVRSACWNTFKLMVAANLERPGQGQETSSLQTCSTFVDACIFRLTGPTCLRPA